MDPVAPIKTSSGAQPPGKRRVLVLGGGFAGGYAAMHLERRLAGAPDIEVVLISKENLLATIGRRAGVAEILGVQFSGIIAWWLWRAIYLGMMPGLQKKVRVALDWALDLCFSKDIVQLPTLKSHTISEQEDSTLPRAETARPEQRPNGHSNLAGSLHA
jgi:glycine/D-amino acid oxidase-like deaminating enzyme